MKLEAFLNVYCLFAYYRIHSRRIQDYITKVNQ
nr:MAG TPA: Dynamin GTPase effector domain [Caudoviricetes sp.]